MPLSMLSTYAKMSFSPCPPSLQKFGAGNRNSSEPRRKLVSYTLPNGKVISSDGLPDGLADEELEKVIAALEDKDQVK
jgi:hypothetical protein